MDEYNGSTNVMFRALFVWVSIMGVHYLMFRAFLVLFPHVNLISFDLFLIGEEQVSMTVSVNGQLFNIQRLGS